MLTFRGRRRIRAGGSKGLFQPDLPRDGLGSGGGIATSSRTGRRSHAVPRAPLIPGIRHSVASGCGHRFFHLQRAEQVSRRGERPTLHLPTSRALAGDDRGGRSRRDQIHVPRASPPKRPNPLLRKRRPAIAGNAMPALTTRMLPPFCCARRSTGRPDLKGK